MAGLLSAYPALSLILGEFMRKTQLHWLIVETLVLSIIDILLLNQCIQFTETEKITLILLHVLYVLLFIVPVILTAVKARRNFIDTIAILLSAYFIYQMITLIVCVLLLSKYPQVEIAIDIIIFSLFIFLLIVNVVEALKKPVGPLSNVERDKVKNCIDCFDYLQQPDLKEISSELNTVLCSNQIIVHGVSENVFSECTEIYKAVLLNDDNGKKKHEAILKFYLDIWKSKQ